MAATETFTPELVALTELRPHPRNYRAHPDDQLEHLVESLKEHGVYRNILIARDGTVLAGHGIVAAAQRLGLTQLPAIRLPLAPDEPRALKVLAADNELGHLAEVDDRALSELLKEVNDTDLAGLLGTGYDAAMLANLVMVTRPAGEIADHDAAAEWVGMPDYTPMREPEKVIVAFRNDADRQEFARRLGLILTERTKSIWWPPREREDLAALALVPEAAPA